MTPSRHLPNKNPFSLLSLAAAFLLPCGGVLHAAVLANYDFNGVVTSSTIPPNASLSVVSTGNPGLDPGITLNSNANNVAWTQNVVNSVGTDSSAALSLSGNWYIEFTITPSSGYALSLDSLTFDMGGSSNAGQTFNANFFVRSNLAGTGFDTNVGTLQTVFVPGGSPGSNTPGEATIDLSSLSMFQDVQVATTFRVYGYVSDASIATKNTRPRLNDLILNGSVDAVPEPGTAVLAALGLAGCAILRRRVRAGSR